MYARVPAIDGRPQVGTNRLIIGTSLSAIEAIAIVEGVLQPVWTELTEAEYLALGGVIPTPAPVPVNEVELLKARIAKLEVDVTAIKAIPITPIK